MERTGCASLYPEDEDFKGIIDVDYEASAARAWLIAIITAKKNEVATDKVEERAGSKDKQEIIS